jgi:hypothetical protein
MPNFTKIRPLGAELFRKDRRTDRHGEADSRFSQFCDTRLINMFNPYLTEKSHLLYQQQPVRTVYRNNRCLF